MLQRDRWAIWPITFIWCHWSSSVIFVIWSIAPTTNKGYSLFLSIRWPSGDQSPCSFLLAFVFLLVGIKKQLKQLRIIALSLLGITIVKLFVYDISNVSETGKIIAFILLGVLVLVISFVYQKIKVLVIDEDKKNQDDKVD